MTEGEERREHIIQLLTQTKKPISGTELAKKSFRNLIREDEQQKIESSIWEQIDSGNENDYIHFHLRKADGSYLSVLDHGRIVNSQQYGRVFYVLFTDWEDMHIHYGDKFSE